MPLCRALAAKDRAKRQGQCQPERNRPKSVSRAPCAKNASDRIVHRSSSLSCRCVSSCHPRKAHLLALFHGCLREGLLLGADIHIVRGQLLLDFLDALDEKLELRFLRRFLRRLLHVDQLLELRGIRMRQIECQLRAAGADELIENRRG